MSPARAFMFGTGLPVVSTIVVLLTVGGVAAVWTKGECARTCRSQTCPRMLSCHKPYWDACRCCRVCPRKEGRRCFDRPCEESLSCNLRNISSSTQSPVGICEPRTCVGVSCPYRQRCALNETGFPVCMCAFPRRCAASTEEGNFQALSCGLLDGRLYPSQCLLQQRECMTGVRIESVDSRHCLPVERSRGGFSASATCNSTHVILMIPRLMANSFRTRALGLKGSHCQFIPIGDDFVLTSNTDQCGFKSTFALGAFRHTHSLAVASYADQAAAAENRLTTFHVRMTCVHFPSNRFSQTVLTLHQAFSEHMRLAGERAQLRRMQLITSGKMNSSSPLLYSVPFSARLTRSDMVAFPHQCTASSANHRAAVEIGRGILLFSEGCPLQQDIRTLTVYRDTSAIVYLFVPPFSVHYLAEAFVIHCWVKICQRRDHQCLPSCTNLS